MEPPAHLRRFDAADWPPEDGDPLDQWRDARSEYVRANGWWPGDELDELRERRDVILRYHSGRICPRLPRDCGGLIKATMLDSYSRHCLKGTNARGIRL